MNWIDRTIGYFNPRAGLMRAYARTSMEYVAAIEKKRAERFSYEGARTGRRTDGWTAAGTSANAEVGQALVLLRNRSRELSRNNRYARKAVKELAGNIVGTGIQAQANTCDKKLDKVIQTEWDIFVEQCDADGQLDWYGMQRQAVRAVVESGEILCRFRSRRESDGLRVPLQIQTLESDFLDHSRTIGLPNNSGYIIQGIEFDPINRRRAYWLFNQHPGEIVWMNPQGGILSRPIPAYDVVHLYDKERPGQVRGIPWLAAVMLAMRDLDDYEDAERFRKKVEACVVAFVTQAATEVGGTPALGAQAKDQNTGNLVESFEPGMIERLRPGQDIKFNNPQPSGGYREYKTAELQGIAAGADVTYERMTADYSNVNFSSWRGGDLSFRNNIEAFQWLMCVPMYCNPIWRRFIDTLVLVGKIPADPEKANVYGVEWHMPPRQTIDPEGDAKAERLEIRTGTKTLPQAIIQRGRDPESHMAEIAASNALLDKYGIVSDADPRKTTDRWQEQSAPAAAAASGKEKPVKAAAEDSGETHLLSSGGRRFGSWR